jgi:hypothetical protein
LGKRKGAISKRPRKNWDYKYSPEIIMAVKRRELNPRQFAEKFNIPIELAQRTVYGMRDPNTFKWAKFITEENND